MARTVCYQVFGHVDATSAEHDYIMGLLKDQLKVANNHLKGKKYFVGNSLTIVDIFFALTILELQQGVMDANFRISLSNLNNHFKEIIGLQAFKNRMGCVKIGKKQITPAFLLSASGKDLNKAQKKENSKQKATKQ